jgi:hypothetical protein
VQGGHLAEELPGPEHRQDDLLALFVADADLDPATWR